MRILHVRGQSEFKKRGVKVERVGKASDDVEHRERGEILKKYSSFYPEFQPDTHCVPQIDLN